MTDQHPITPPPELVQQWRTEWIHNAPFVVTRAAQWGADQELEACCKWLQCEAGDSATEFVAGDLRTARRPKPPSLKEQALEELNLTADPNGAELSRTQVELIRRALEALPDD
jgi:hypothetical protein